MADEKADESTPARDAAADPAPPAKKAAKSTSAKSTSAKATKAAKATKTTKSTGSAKSTGATKSAKAAKSTGPAKKAPAQAEQAQAEPSAAEPPAAVASQPVGGDRARGVDTPDALAGTVAPGVWADAAWQALQQLDQPPRRLAELAVAELGPRAAAWATWLRDRYPAAPDYGVARLATQEAVRGGRALALGAAGGPFTAPLLLPATAWVWATVILRVAAAYRQDPTDPARADDLIELLDLDPAATGEPFSLLGFGGIAGAAGQQGLARFAVSRLGLRRTPAAAALRVMLAAGDHSEQLTLLAHRAIRHFRPVAGAAVADR
ncbi:hypothetical protein JQS43_23540 [Natronosporangium hydrolyticum]|uniref:Uncharacterized protein n=1 Tax=Natronosporangium hydrolyticum TaxID=2811111 RepID=A0A895YKQ8_9ACTN|nr:hypothetical protein [Natronosporangium hydrolyticum]QSB14428.1 hypothetical protein JQS43_23540 [Natronosporangium hydrolyticum]